MRITSVINVKVSIVFNVMQMPIVHAVNVLIMRIFTMPATVSYVRIISRIALNAIHN
jgi:hypothetical protein